MKGVQRTFDKNSLLLFGGSYGNIEALESLRDWAEKNHFEPSQVFFSGDAAAYCADPEACYRLLQEWNCHSISGNVETQLRDGADDCGCEFTEGGRCDVFSRNWFPFVQNSISQQSLDWISKLPDWIEFEFAGKRVVLLHGSHEHNAEYIFASTPVERKLQIMEALQVDLVLAGHSGLPFHQKIGNKVWVNSGALGMPANDRTTDVWFATIELKNDQIQFQHHRLTYNHEEAARKMRSRNLPESYAKTLEDGIWDNCEILPEIETLQQGARINLDLESRRSILKL
jgi:predicted phosphodiesterase